MYLPIYWAAERSDSLEYRINFSSSLFKLSWALYDSIQY